MGRVGVDCVEPGLPAEWSPGMTQPRPVPGSPRPSVAGLLPSGQDHTPKGGPGGEQRAR